MFTYYKAEGYDFFGFPCTVYFRTKKPIHSETGLATCLHCAETGNVIACVHAPHASYALAYAWYTHKGKHTTPETWSADVISTLTL